MNALRAVQIVAIGLVAGCVVVIFEGLAILVAQCLGV